MEFFENYLTNIATFVVFVALIEMILPSDSFGKYIKFFVGFIVMINIIKPIITVVYDFNFNDFKIDTYEYEVNLDNASSDFIKAEIENNIRNILLRKFNIEILSMDIEFSEVRLDYFYISSISITLDCDEDTLIENKKEIENLIFYEYFEHLDNIYLTYDI